MSNNPQEIIDLLVMLFSLFVEFACLVFFILLTCFSWRQFRNTWRRGLVVGILTFVLGVPSVIAGAFYIDLSRFAPEIRGDMVPVMKVFAGIVAIGILGLQIPFRGIYYHVAACEWGRIRGYPLPALSGPPRNRLMVNLFGCGVGLLTLVLTTIIFYLCNVQERQGDGDKLADWFPGFMTMPPLLLAFVLSTFVAVFAVVEELIFRGGILGFLIRITGNRTGLSWLFIAGVSLLWAVLHYPNTDNPPVKIGQIFFMGLALGEMTRRWGISPAICAHVALNVGAVVFS